MLKTTIKAGRVQNLTDARYFAAWNVDWLGFNLEAGAPNSITPKQLQDIRAWVAGPKIVGEFGLGQTGDEIKEAIHILNLDAVQLAHFVQPEVAQVIHFIPIIKEVKLTTLNDCAELHRELKLWEYYTTFFVLDFRQNTDWTWENLRTNWQFMQEFAPICKEFKIMLHLDCQPENLHELLQSLHLYGLAVEGGAEERVGVKSFDDLDTWFEAIAQE